jgi:hypothetical protein
LRAAAQLGASIEPPAWLDGAYRQPPHTLVACANALMHLPSKILVPHTPSFFNHNALNFDYEPFAPEPRQRHTASPSTPSSSPGKNGARSKAGIAQARSRASVAT